MIANMSSNKLKITAGVSAIILAAILVSATITKPAQTALPVATSAASTTASASAQNIQGFAATLQYTQNLLAIQNQTDANMLNELNSGRYTFKSPLVIVDPYNQSPLTAMALFTTEKPVQISIHIEGADSLTNVDFTFDGYNTRHIIPVYGLYPGTENLVTLTETDQSGAGSSQLLQIKTEPLPDSLAKNIIQTDLPDKTKYQPGLNFTYGMNTQKTAFDAYGKYRWFLNGSYLFAGMYNYNNHYIVAKGTTDQGDVLFYEVNAMGRIYRVFYAPYGVHHDIAEIPDGNLLVTGTNGQTLYDFIYEVNMKTGTIQNTLDLKTVFQRSRKGYNDSDSTDWLHLNAIVPVPGTDKIIVSGKRQSLVAQISWPDGHIDWMLAPQDNWLPMFQKQVLKPLGDTELPDNQHAPEILPDYDNNSDTMDLLLFDNGTGRAANGIFYSRLVQYRIDEKNRTVQQIWEYGKEEGRALYSSAKGDANLLENGNRLGMFLVASNDDKAATSNYIEVDKNAKVVWEASAVSTDADGTNLDYRTVRMPIYNNAANDLQIGTPAVNMIPKEEYEKEGIKIQ